VALGFDDPQMPRSRREDPPPHPLPLVNRPDTLDRGPRADAVSATRSADYPVW